MTVTTTTTNATTSNGPVPGTMATLARVDPALTATAPAAVNVNVPPPPPLAIVPDPAQGHRQIGDLSADALSRSIEATANDVLAAGRAVTDVAADIMREATELAAGISRCGVAFAAHVTQFATLAQQVSDTMRSTRQHVLGAPGDPAASSP